MRIKYNPLDSEGAVDPALRDLLLLRLARLPVLVDYALVFAEDSAMAEVGLPAVWARIFPAALIVCPLDSLHALSFAAGTRALRSHVSNGSTTTLTPCIR